MKSKTKYAKEVTHCILSAEDIEAIDMGYRKREEVVSDALSRELDNPENYRYAKRLNLLANLIADNRLDIRIALHNTALF